MKAILKKLSALLIAGLLPGIFPALAQNTPYPIIFVHGINSDDLTWGKQDNKYDDIVDHLTGAGLKFGGKLAVTLAYKRSANQRSTGKEQDVKLFTDPIAADFYAVSFNTHATGKVPVVHKLGPIVFKPAVSGSVTATATQFNVSYPTEFIAGDIIRVEDEFMQVTAVSGSKLTVSRAIYGSTAVRHGAVTVYNLSNLSNQAAIVKQGYGLKLVIDAVKQKTGAQKVVLLGHSMGGLAIREYLRQNPRNDIAKIVTIGTPHYGTNITDLSPSLLQLINIDGRSDAVRDLRATLPGSALAGPYLFGGNESAINYTQFYSRDINADGTESGTAAALNANENLLALLNIPRTWIASSGDGLVPLQSQYIGTADTMMINKFHTDETSDYYSLLRGLDEPGDAESAYSIAESGTIKGFITINKNNNPVDVDVYKVTLNKTSVLNFGVAANVLSGIKKITLTNANNQTLLDVKLNAAVKDTLTAGTYYINIGGLATNGPNPTYRYPYALSTLTNPLTPAASLAYGTPDFDPKPEFKGVTYTSSNPAVAIIVNNKVRIKGVGFTTISGTLGGAKMSGVLQIHKAKLTISVDNKTKTHGTENPPFTASYSGFVYGETATSLTKLPEFFTFCNILSPEDTYAITASGAASNNYAITYLPGTITVTAAADAPLLVNKAISPNADGINDHLEISNISQYPNNHVMITNSRGVKVFEASGYDNSAKRFEGYSGGGKLPQGTYYYTIAYGRQKQAGYLVIKY